MARQKTNVALVRKKAREATTPNHMTVAKLAKCVNYSRSYVSQFINGMHNDTALAEKLREFLK